MLDLKSKLMEAGLVGDEDVKRVEQQEKARRDKRRAMANKRKQQKQRQKDKFQRLKFYNRQHIKDRKQWASKVEKLKKEEKNAAYQVIKSWVERFRLDPVRPDFTEELERYAYQKHNGSISFVSVPKAVEEQLRIGDAGIVSFMSDHGLVHAVVPRDCAIDIHQVFPAWLRGLNAYEYELLIEEPVEVAEVDEEAIQPTPEPESEQIEASTEAQAQPALKEREERPSIRIRKKDEEN